MAFDSIVDSSLTLTISSSLSVVNTFTFIRRLGDLVFSCDGTPTAKLRAKSVEKVYILPRVTHLIIENRFSDQGTYAQQHLLPSRVHRANQMSATNYKGALSSLDPP
jgi:hypothetical protein